MKTREEILEEACNNHGAFLHIGDDARIIDGSSDAAIEAMSTFAKEVAIAYGHWIMKKILLYHLKSEEPPMPEAEELFNQFIQQYK
jgi:hypothetical protein